MKVKQGRSKRSEIRGKVREAPFSLLLSFFEREELARAMRRVYRHLGGLREHAVRGQGAAEEGGRERQRERESRSGGESGVAKIGNGFEIVEKWRVLVLSKKKC